MNPMEKQLVSLIESGVQWSDLDLFLQKNGLVQTNYDRVGVVNTIQRIWANNNVVSDQNLDSTSFPGSRLILNERTIYIHGVVHDSMPDIILNNKFKKNIANVLLGKIVLCEDGFKEWIPNAESFNEIDYFQLYHLKTKNSSQNKSPKYVSEIPIENILNMETIKDFIPIRELLLQSYLPEPLGINSYFYVNNLNTIDNATHIPSLSLQRYIYEAKKIVIMSDSMKSEELHIVVGCRHERPLAYFLSNQSLLEKCAKLV